MNAFWPHGTWLGATIGEKTTEYWNAGVQYASKLAEQNQSRNDHYVTYPSYAPVQNGARQSDLTSAR